MFTHAPDWLRSRLPFKARPNPLAQQGPAINATSRSVAITHGPQVGSARPAAQWHPSLPPPFVLVNQLQPEPMRPFPLIAQDKLNNLSTALQGDPALYQAVSIILTSGDPVLTHMADWLTTLDAHHLHTVLAKVRNDPEALICEWLAAEHPCVEAALEHITELSFEQLQRHPNDVYREYIWPSNSARHTGRGLTRDDVANVGMPRLQDVEDTLEMVLNSALHGVRCKPAHIPSHHWATRLAGRIARNQANDFIRYELQQRLTRAHNDTRPLIAAAHLKETQQPPFVQKRT